MKNNLTVCPLLLFLLIFSISSFGMPKAGFCKAADTLIVTAEGLADPNADTYRRDKGLLYDALLDDAKRQALEKVVGIYVEGHSLVENYSLIHDKVLTQTRGLIKKIHKKSEPWLGKDGFMHILIRAEVYSGQAQNALREMSRAQRIDLIRGYGNPKIAVSTTVRDAKRGSFVKAERSQIAENILKEHLSSFGYRVWSEEVGKELDLANAEKSMVRGQSDMAAYYSHQRGADFIIRGEVKFRPISLTLKSSGIKIDKLQLTSWTVKCVDNRSGEEIYFNNKVPTRMSWNTEDAALKAVGSMIADEFTEGFFDSQMMQKSRIYQLEVQGLPAYDSGVLFKKELIGLRPVLNVDFRSFERSTVALFEVEFAGNDLKFAELLNTSILGSLNAKFQQRVFHLDSVQGSVIKVSFSGSSNAEKIRRKFETGPPSSLATATPDRLAGIALSKNSLKKIEEINPDVIPAVVEYQKNKGSHSSSGEGKSIEAIKNF